MNCENTLTVSIDAEIEKLLKDIAVEEGFCEYTIENKSACGKGDGYFGEIAAVCIIGANKSKKKQELSLIVKSAHKSSALRKQMPIVNTYRREIYLYTTVFPTLQQFQIEKGLSPFSCSAKCYKTCSLEFSEALILEDLRTRGFNVWERTKVMEHDQVALVMEEFGRFHALSFALRDQKPDKFKKIANGMANDVFHEFVMNDSVMAILKQHCLKALHSLDPETNRKAFKVFSNFIDESMEEYVRNLTTQTDEFSTILHGDCWSSNILFNHTDEQSQTKPSKICLIDLQISKVGSPVLDLSYFLYTCSSKTIVSNYEQYLNIYYDSLSSYLRILGSNVETLYPYSVFRRHWVQFAKFGFICGLTVIQISLTDGNEAVALTDLAENDKLHEAFDCNVRTNEAEYNDRVKSIILHFVENKFM